MRTDVDLNEFDRCGRLGMEMIAEKSDVSAQSIAMLGQMSEGFIAALADFFDDQNMPIETVQKRLHDILSQGRNTQGESGCGLLAGDRC